MEIIQFTPINLSRQKIIDYGKCGLTLFDTYLIYDLDFLAEEPDRNDEEMPWVKRKEQVTIVVKRENISKIERFFVQESNVWKIEIEILGVA